MGREHWIKSSLASPSLCRDEQLLSSLQIQLSMAVTNIAMVQNAIYELSSARRDQIPVVRRARALSPSGRNIILFRFGLSPTLFLPCSFLLISLGSRVTS